MYKSILIPVDLSSSDKAKAMLDTARQLGGDSVKIILLHIIEEIPNFISSQAPVDYEGRARAMALEELEKIAGSTDLEAEIEIKKAYPSRGILSVADEKKVDAIIIASHRPGYEDYLLGSTASRVVRHAKCTVIVIR